MVYIAGVKSSVDTGDTYFQEISLSPIAGSKLAKRKLAERKLAERGIVSKMPEYDGNPVDARIEYARYIVDCPNCGNAEFAFEDKLFFCSACRNNDISGQARKVKMPKDRKKIEDILSKRMIVNRHWTNETVEQLQAENDKQGIK